MAQNKEYQCVFNQHFNCDYSSPCRGCVNFAPDAAINKNASHNKQSTSINCLTCADCADLKCSYRHVYDTACQHIKRL